VVAAHVALVHLAILEQATSKIHEGIETDELARAHAPQGADANSSLLPFGTLPGPVKNCVGKDTQCHAFCFHELQRATSWLPAAQPTQLQDARPSAVEGAPSRDVKLADHVGIGTLESWIFGFGNPHEQHRTSQGKDFHHTDAKLSWRASFPSNHTLTFSVRATKVVAFCGQIPRALLGGEKFLVFLDGEVALRDDLVEWPSNANGGSLLVTCCHAIKLRKTQGQKEHKIGFRVAWLPKNEHDKWSDLAPRLYHPPGVCVAAPRALAGDFDHGHE
jgi:hypothetical protein